MPENTTQNDQKQRRITEILRDSTLIIITLIFVLLYAAAYAGKFDPLKDNTMLLRLEPLIFILIGYCFGRIPARQNEQTLKDEITRQTQKADAAQYAKEKAQLERETLEEKIRNTRTSLKSDTASETIAAKTALGILDS